MRRFAEDVWMAPARAANVKNVFRSMLDLTGMGAGQAVLSVAERSLILSVIRIVPTPATMPSL